MMRKISIDGLSKGKDFRKFLKFLLVGGTVFIIHTFSLWLFKRVFFLDTIISASVAYIVAVISHFLMNNFFTFNDSGVLYRRRIMGYIAVVVCNYIISIIIVTGVLAHVVDNVVFATVASTSVTTLFSFFVLNKLVYSNKTTEA